jgi:HEAT repeat protein
MLDLNIDAISIIVSLVGIAVGIAGIIFGIPVIIPIVRRLFLRLSRGGYARERLNAQTLSRVLSANDIWDDKSEQAYVLPIRFHRMQFTPNEAQIDDIPPRTIELSELLEKLDFGLNVLVGQSGSGKSFALAKLSEHVANTTDLGLVFVPLEIFKSNESLHSDFASSISTLAYEHLAKQGRILFLFDGLNQVQTNNKANVVTELRRLAGQFPQCKIVISCRETDLPAAFWSLAKIFSIALPTKSASEMYLKDSGNDISNLSNEVRELCNTPLFLSMLREVLNDSENSTLPSNRSSLYTQFLKTVFSREEALNSLSIPRRHRECLLSHLAFQKQGNGVLFEQHEIEELVDNFLSSNIVPTKKSAEDFIHEVINRPPIRRYKFTATNMSSSGYLHHSFLEYYAARWIKDFSRESNRDQQALSYCTPAHQLWWPTIVYYCGIVNDAAPIILGIIQRAVMRGDTIEEQRLFQLAALCINEAKELEAEVVDQLIINVIFAFKYGSVSFNQELVETIGLVPRERYSHEFPARLINDLDYWTSKYTRVTSYKVSDAAIIRDLVRDLESPDSTTILNALARLGAHPQRSEATEQVLNLFAHSDLSVREQSLLVAGYLDDQDKRVSNALRLVLHSKGSSSFENAYAMLSIAKLGPLELLQDMISCLKNKDTPYRDNASWAIFGIVTKNGGEALIKQIQDVYAEALLEESDPYALANIVYCLGELGAKEKLIELRAWYDLQTDALLLEDGIIALGKIGTPEDLRRFLDALKHDDPLVRLAAIRAIETYFPDVTKLEQKELLVALEMARDDDVSIVNQEAANLFEQLKLDQ